jgi:hypothetical protein
MGLHGTGLEINPFLVWFSSVKSRRFETAAIQRTREIGSRISVVVSSEGAPRCDPPPIHNIGRWWNASELDFLCRLKAGIIELSHVTSDERDLLLIAFCRTIIRLSNAAFNHQSMSFRKKDGAPALFDLSIDGKQTFLDELAFVLSGACDNPEVVPSIIAGDARNPSMYLHNKYDVLVTSPPYPNRISYIRELRPYMYWLDYLSNGRDAGEIDWQAIGGTWGIATSRLAEWTSAGDGFTPEVLGISLAEVSRPENKNGRLLSNYIAKYFEDIWHHVEDVGHVLNPGAEVHYIVGNSTFYGTLVPVEEIYKAMLEHAGFCDAHIVRIRKRNSKAELFEFDVAAKMIQSKRASM